MCFYIHRLSEKISGLMGLIMDCGGRRYFFLPATLAHTLPIQTYTVQYAQSWLLGLQQSKAERGADFPEATQVGRA